MAAAAARADFIVTATGNIHVLGKKHLPYLKDGVIIANAGHFNVEIDIPALSELAKGEQVVKENIKEYLLADGRRVYLLADGRLVNLSCGEGHPVEVMDLSFANQALSAAWLFSQKGKLQPGVYGVPRELDGRVALLKLKTLGVRLETLTGEQKDYLASWEAGT
jgi:adenosylhomocysteinase